MKKNVKYAIIAIVIGVVYVLFALLITGDKKEEDTKEFLVIGNTLILEKSKDGLKQINEVTDEIMNQKFTIYDGVQKKENVKLQHASNEWMFLTEDYDNVEVTNFRLAYTKGDYMPAEYQINSYSESDETMLEDYLTENLYNLTSEFKIGTNFVEFDFDRDGIKERIYTTTNFSFSSANDNLFSSVFMTRGNKVVQTLESNEQTPYGIYSILDIDNDGVYELIVIKGSIDVPTFDSCYQIYKLKEGKWKLIKNCN